MTPQEKAISIINYYAKFYKKNIVLLSKANIKYDSLKEVKKILNNDNLDAELFIYYCQVLREINKL